MSIVISLLSGLTFYLLVKAYRTEKELKRVKEVLVALSISYLGDNLSGVDLDDNE